jgi:hypothetical protein
MHIIADTSPNSFAPQHAFPGCSPAAAVSSHAASIPSNGAKLSRIKSADKLYKLAKSRLAAEPQHL